MNFEFVMFGREESVVVKQTRQNGSVFFSGEEFMATVENEF